MFRVDGDGVGVSSHSAAMTNTHSVLDWTKYSRCFCGSPQITIAQ